MIAARTFGRLLVEIPNAVALVTQSSICRLNTCSAVIVGDGGHDRRIGSQRDAREARAHANRPTSSATMFGVDSRRSRRRTWPVERPAHYRGGGGDCCQPCPASVDERPLSHRNAPEGGIPKSRDIVRTSRRWLSAVRRAMDWPDSEDHPR